MPGRRFALSHLQMADLPASSICRFRFTSCASALGDPAAMRRRTTMKNDIHPAYVETQVTCTCGNSFTTRSTATSGVIHADVCSNCHPFYTGKQKILDTGGRVARFEKRYAQAQAKK
jgi:large subunit ribosomal protein L31